jgi:alkanesulfonate monooxygenase SsuD/methylene tetrahydromethanopterin reductase-like flavin-dependent oxidoreductase (luciferase family)
MKFAYFTHLPWPEGRTAARIIADTTEQVEYAEALGFHSAWLAEHHFTRYSIGSSSLIIATHLAAHTRRIRLGTAVLVSPLHNPLRLAEDTATLDLISGGRLDVGFGRGSGSGYEYHGYNIDPAESQARFQDSIRMIRGLWTTPDFTFESRYFQARHANLVPMPVQQPHPPVYIAATRTPTTLEFAVSTGFPLCIAVVQDTDEALDLCQRFVEKSAESGFNVPKSQIPFFRYFYVAGTAEQAINDTRDRLDWVADIMQWRNSISQGSEVHQHLSDWRRSRRQLPLGYEYLAEKRAIIGTPDQCVARINLLREQGIDYFGCNFDFGGMEHHKVLDSMKLFAEEVMPRLG